MCLLGPYEQGWNGGSPFVALESPNVGTDIFEIFRAIC